MLCRNRLVFLQKICKQFSISSASNMTTQGVGLNMELETKSFLEEIFRDSVKSVLPQKLIGQLLKVESNNMIVGNKWFKLNQNVHLVGFGKAVLGMAATTEKILKHHLRSGIVCVPRDTMEVFKDSPQFLLKSDSVIKVLEGASGNLPDEDALKGAEAVISNITSLAPSDILIILISGGGSALLPMPREGITLEDKLSTIKLLSSAGATINDLNTLRKHLSVVKGGGLAVLSYPVQTITFILSDVVNDPLDIIASGPTVPNCAKSDAAFNIIKKYNILNCIPENVLEILQKDYKNPCVPITSKGFSHVENFIIGNNIIALQQAKLTAEKLGFRTVLLSNVINSPVNIICDLYVTLAFEICKVLHTYELDAFVLKIIDILKTCSYDFPKYIIDDLLSCIKLQGFCKGICIIAGGETTVKVRGRGIGGRNQELALRVSQKLFKLKKENSSYFKKFDITFLSAGTDGIDGNSCAAGAVGCADLISRALDNYIDPNSYLVNNDSYNFFKTADCGTHLITTGHTGTNVMDIHIIAIRNITSLGLC